MLYLLLRAVMSSRGEMFQNLDVYIIFFPTLLTDAVIALVPVFFCVVPLRHIHDLVIFSYERYLNFVKLLSGQRTMDGHCNKIESYHLSRYQNEWLGNNWNGIGTSTANLVHKSAPSPTIPPPPPHSPPSPSAGIFTTTYSWGVNGYCAQRGTSL